MPAGPRSLGVPGLRVAAAAAAERDPAALGSARFEGMLPSTPYVMANWLCTCVHIRDSSEHRYVLYNSWFK